RLVMAGKRPFIDFETAYGPWFLVLCSWALRLWNSGAVLVLLAILFEFIAWGFWICVMRDLMEERDAKLSACLYALAPLPFINVAMVGMNHVWITAFLGAATLWQRRDRHALSALAMGASVV